MKQNDIIRMAREAGFEIGSVTGAIYAPASCQSELERFAALVAAFAAEKEREACAQTCEERHANGNYQHDTRHECAEAIRNRGKEVK